jgi:hypothetical protein
MPRSNTTNKPVYAADSIASVFGTAVGKVKDLINYGAPKPKKEQGEGLGRTAKLLKKVDY